MTENPVPVATDITDDDKLWSLLSWIIWVIGVIALLMEDKKDRPFVKYNAVMSLVVGIVLTIVVGITSPFTCGITVILFAYPIYLGIKAYQGEWVVVPVITDFVKNQGWASIPEA
jgi:uncharacterized membrane protein